MSDREEQIRRANEARRITTSDVFKDAVAEVDAHYTHIWKSSTGNQAEIRERAYYAMLALNDVIKVLAGYIENGVLEEHKNEQEEAEKTFRV